MKRVSKGKPAEEAGILPGDKIIKVGDVDLIKAGKDLQETLKRNTEVVVDLTVLRNDKELTVQVKPYKEGDRRLIGIELDGTQRMIVKTLSLGQAFKEAIDKNIQIIGSIFDILQRLFKREVSVRMLEGPIGIARHSGMAAESGFSDLLMLMAFISLNLGIMNLLPIPVLDGGVIAIILLETVNPPRPDSSHPRTHHTSGFCDADPVSCSRDLQRHHSHAACLARQILPVSISELV